MTKLQLAGNIGIGNQTMISMDRQYRTRDGREVRIYALDGGQEKSIIHGAVKEKGAWNATTWSKGGTYYGDGHRHKNDLVEVTAETPKIKTALQSLADRYYIEQETRLMQKAG